MNLDFDKGRFTSLRIMERTRINKASFFVPGYIPQFDCLRGVAVLMVLISHSGFLELLPHAGMLKYPGYGALDSYFVLSGFLITGILLDSKGSEHYFRNFYVRRAVRIWPLYYLVLFLVFVIEPLFMPATRPTVASIWPAFTFYVQNLIYHGAYPFGLAATWSLAVEEQFYITWPLLVFFLKKRTLAVFLVFLFVAVGGSMRSRCRSRASTCADQNCRNCASQSSSS